MIYYRGQFADIKENKFVVDIIINTDIIDTTVHELKFGETPCVISTKSSGLYSPIKSRSCTITLLTTELLNQIWTPTSQGTTVNVYNTNGEDAAISNYVDPDWTMIFHGYLTPCAYTQSYSQFIESLELEAVDGLSTLKDFKYENRNDQWSQIVSFRDILATIFSKAGYTGNIYIPKTYSKIDETTINGSIFSLLSISEGNFFDDDEEHTPWTLEDVLSQILMFLGYTAVPDGNDIWLVDYRYIKDNVSMNYFIQNGQNDTPTIISNYNALIDGDSYSSNGQSVSIDKVYNTITIRDNTYNLETLFNDVMEDNAHISVSEEKGLGSSGSVIYQTTRKGWWFWRHDEVKSLYEYKSICRLNPEYGWLHRYYKHSTLGELDNTDGMGYYDSSSTSQYTGNKINQYLNTNGCLIQHHTIVDRDVAVLPTTVDWNDYLTFFIMDDTSPARTLSQLRDLEVPVLEYEYPEEVVFAPLSGNSWIVINGQMWFQRTFTQDKITVDNIDETGKTYEISPWDGATDANPFNLFAAFSPIVVTPRISYRNEYKRSSNDVHYGEGFGMWKMRLQIGDKYFNGSTWTTTTSEFMLPFNNNPTDGGDEYIECLKWNHVVNNTSFFTKVGKEGYAIQIPSSINLKGKLRLTIYAPRLLPDELINLNPNESFTWHDYSTPVIFIKDFKVDYVYKDSTPWYIQHEIDKDDLIYKTIISTDNTMDSEDMEFKINTRTDEKPISKSYVITGGHYINTMKHTCIQNEQIQEMNILDHFYNHYSSPKLVYDCSVKNYYKPYQKIAVRCLTDKLSNPNYTIQESDYKFVIDTQEWDIKMCSNKITLIQL